MAKSKKLTVEDAFERQTRRRRLMQTIDRGILNLLTTLRSASSRGSHYPFEETVDFGVWKQDAISDAQADMLNMFTDEGGTRDRLQKRQRAFKACLIRIQNSVASLRAVSPSPESYHFDGVVAKRAEWARAAVSDFAREYAFAQYGDLVPFMPHPKFSALAPDTNRVSLRLTSSLTIAALVDESAKVGEARRARQAS